MADTHYHQTRTGLALDQPRVVQPVLAAVVAVSFIGLVVLLGHAFVPGRHAADPGPSGLLFAAGALTLLVLGPLLLAATLRRLRPLPLQSAVEPLTPPEFAPRAARRHRRFVPRHRATTLTTLDGRTIAARIVDLSMGGVAVEAKVSDLEFATVARVGSRVASPIRRTADGAVFGFEALLDPVSLDENLVL